MLLRKSSMTFPKNVFKRPLLALFLFSTLLFTVTVHAAHVDNPYSEVEHLQCQLCQGHIDLPKVTLETPLHDGLVSFAKINQNQYQRFIAKTAFLPPLRAPPISNYYS